MKFLSNHHDRMGRRAFHMAYDSRGLACFLKRFHDTSRFLGCHTVQEAAGSLGVEEKVVYMGRKVLWQSHLVLQVLHILVSHRGHKTHGRVVVRAREQWDSAAVYDYGKSGFPAHLVAVAQQ